MKVTPVRDATVMIVILAEGTARGQRPWRCQLIGVTNWTRLSPAPWNRLLYQLLLKEMARKRTEEFEASALSFILCAVSKLVVRMTWPGLLSRFIAGDLLELVGYSQLRGQVE